jgi:hypothetical protein
MIYLICHGFMMVGFILILLLFQPCSVHTISVNEGDMIVVYPSFCHYGMNIKC